MGHSSKEHYLGYRIFWQSCMQLLMWPRRLSAHVQAGKLIRGMKGVDEDSKAGTHITKVTRERSFSRVWQLTLWHHRTALRMHCLVPHRLCLWGILRAISLFFPGWRSAVTYVHPSLIPQVLPGRLNSRQYTSADTSLHVHFPSSQSAICKVFSRHFKSMRNRKRLLGGTST